MSTTFIQLQNTQQQGTTIGAFQTIFFDNHVSQSGDSDFLFDQNTGIITLNRTGIYYVDWAVMTDSADNPVSILLLTGEGEMIYSNSSLKQDEITGNAILKVDAVPFMLVLSNGPGSITLSDVPVAANLVIHSIEEEDSTGTEPPVEKSYGSILNFQSGVVDCPIFNPFSWPILLQVFQISWMSDCLAELLAVSTPSGLERAVGLPAGVLGNFLTSSQINAALEPLEAQVTTLGSAVDSMSKMLINAGIISTDTYLSHADISVVPAVAGADIPLFGLDGGPMVPQIIAGDGVITTFAAEYDCLAAIDVSIANFLPGVLSTIAELAANAAGAMGTVIATLASLGTVLAGLGAPLPSDYADRLSALIQFQLDAGTPAGNHHVHAVLWHRKDDKESGEAVWNKVADADLGAVRWAELAPLDAFLSSLGDLAAAAGNVIDSILSLLSNRGQLNTSPTNVPFHAGLVKDLNYPVSAGDYLIVQFTLEGGDNTTILAGVIATNVMASVAMQSV